MGVIIILIPNAFKILWFINGLSVSSRFEFN